MQLLLNFFLLFYYIRSYTISDKIKKSILLNNNPKNPILQQFVKDFINYSFYKNLLFNIVNSVKMHI